MKGIKITTLCIAIASVFGVANAETCVKTTYNVIYSCGDGTESGTLPADAVVNYYETFTPATLKSACTPPTGYYISGWAIYINNTQVAYLGESIAGPTPSFKYTYYADILITPNYAPGSSGLIATPADLAANLRVDGSTYTASNGVSGTWQVVFPYGTVNGVSKCTTIMPENTARDAGFIATDQSAIENATAGGQYCYCKMTEPNIAASPWVLGSRYSNASNCRQECASSCRIGVYLTDGFRASVFAGAMAE
ncbi:MAG: hypothetical protein IKJ62_03380 [Alphaproteobacteria bacterium]|nr:hypothetical protein [Alphaproteobacteria bacterium]